ncbi:MAG: GlsB/YeaQ/YmgE family stress response membrane protein [Chitinophagales bacterium]|nr:GlsB/YeaQ/YmgE family stress response membrane protein [Chitinophagales bacterium]
MNILLWILFGLIVGFLAKFIMPGKDPGGFLATIGIGIGGAIVGGFIGNILGLGGVDGFGLGSFVLAILGAILLLYLFRKFKKQ